MRASLAALAAAAAALASCATKAAQTPSRMGVAPGASCSSPADCKEQIRELWEQIRDWRLQSGMAHLPSPALKLDILRVPLATVRRQCEPAPEPETPRCTDACNFSEAICDNAESICDLANALGGDPWADDKCQDAKASCKEAQQRCCDCLAHEGGGADPTSLSPAVF